MTNASTNYTIPDGFIRYFVAYSNGNGEFGCIEIGREHPITSFEDLEHMTAYINTTLNERYKGRVHKVVILNWKRFGAS